MASSSLGGQKENASASNFLRHLPCNSPWVAMDDNNPPKKDGCNLNYNSSLLINVVVVINEELNHCHSSEIRGFMLDEIFQIF